MALNNPGKAQFKVLFWRKWETEGPGKTIGSLALAIMKVSGKVLARAGKRALDFRHPALPGTPPAPGQARKERGSGARPLFPGEPFRTGEIPVQIRGLEEPLALDVDFRRGGCPV